MYRRRKASLVQSCARRTRCEMLRNASNLTQLLPVSFTLPLFRRSVLFQTYHHLFCNLLFLVLYRICAFRARLLVYNKRYLSPSNLSRTVLGNPVMSCAQGQRSMRHTIQSYSTWLEDPNPHIFPLFLLPQFSALLELGGCASVSLVSHFSRS